MVRQYVAEFRTDGDANLFKFARDPDMHHTAADVLKLYFRSLQEPLVHVNYRAFISEGQELERGASPDVIAAKVKNHLSQLPAGMSNVSAPCE